MELHDVYRDHYARHWPAFDTFYRSHSLLPSPLLIDPPEKYRAQPLKLFVIGRETKTWYNTEGRAAAPDRLIHELMAIYKNQFRLGLIHRKSVFWQFVRKLEMRLGIEPGEILWSNIHKADWYGGSPPPDIGAQLRAVLPVLPDEILLTNPDAVLFLTGASNDHIIQEWFPNATFSQVLGSNGLLARVEHPQLPKQTFRTYHPRALKLFGHWKQMLELLPEWLQKR